MAVTTLSDLVFHIREVSGGRPDLLIVRERGRRLAQSTADFLRGVHSLALALEARGLHAGERVAIFFENRPEWHMVDLACQLIGAVTVPISPELPQPQVGFILRNSASCRVFYGNTGQRDLLQALESSLTAPPDMVAVDGEAAAPGGTSITRLMGEGATLLGEIPIERFRGRAQAREPANLIYLAAEAGEPRGVEISHQDAVCDLHVCGETFDISSIDAVVSGLPLTETTQRTIDRLGFHRGAQLCYAPAADDVTPTLHSEGPTLLTAANELFEEVYRQTLERFPREKLGRRELLRWAVATGRRYASARGGFVGPVLGLRRRLADLLVHRDTRQALGGRLRQAVSSGPLTTELSEFFEASGVAVIAAADLTADGRWATKPA